jgi:hypothetical protein
MEGVHLPGVDSFIGYAYVDRQAGPSAKGGPLNDQNLADAPAMTVRLPMPGMTLQVLGKAEIERLGLPAKPTWVEKFYGPQPPIGTLWGWWREHPKLKNRFRPDFPDDLQVLAHDGGPRLTDRRPELVWVRVSGGEDNVFRGILLNQPHQLLTVAQGDEIQFIAPQGGEYLLRVTEKYLRERTDWVIQPCNKCGLSELFDPPSDLLRVVFPNMPSGADTKAFTAYCGACGGILVVRHKNCPSEDVPIPLEKPQSKRKWWKFWGINL